MNMSSVSPLPLPGQFGCAEGNDIWLQAYQKLPNLSSYDRDKVPFSMLAWMPHLTVHLCQDWWLCEWVQRSNCLIVLCQSILKLRQNSEMEMCLWLVFLLIQKPNRRTQSPTCPYIIHFNILWEVKETETDCLKNLFEFSSYQWNNLRCLRMI